MNNLNQMLLSIIASNLSIQMSVVLNCQRCRNEIIKSNQELYTQYRESNQQKNNKTIITDRIYEKK